MPARFTVTDAAARQSTSAPGVFPQLLCCQNIRFCECFSGTDFAGVMQCRGPRAGPSPSRLSAAPGRTWQTRVSCCVSPGRLLPAETCGTDVSLVTRVSVGSRCPLSCSVGTAALSFVSWPPYRTGRSNLTGTGGTPLCCCLAKGPAVAKVSPFQAPLHCGSAAWSLGRVTRGSVCWCSAQCLACGNYIVLLVRCMEGAPRVRWREDSLTAICHMFRRWLLAPAGCLAFLSWQSGCLP